jgi:catechol 2,3-dioxygenase-like lactoylglutathione lyase family enzyme
VSDYTPDIQGLHHSAYRCRDSEQTRQFYEDFLGLRLASALPLTATKTGRPVRALHTFYEMADGSFIAFFEVPGDSTEGLFEDKSDFDLHLAVEVPDMATLESYQKKGLEAGLEVRGPADHGFVTSIYFRDPNGYVVELTAKQPGHDAHMSAEVGTAHDVLADWQRTKHEPL